MAEKKFSELTTAAILGNDDIFALSQIDSGSLTSKKTTLTAIANHINTVVQYTNAYGTQAKTTAGAINELKQLISLIPQFSIEVVEELPTEDISDTTIYLVPAEDPEVGNYYEEYIHVNNTWELVGTTAVDLSAYYTKLEVDGLLATKASAAEVTAALATKENKSDMPTDVRTIIKDCKTPKNATITNGIAQFNCIEENLVKGLKVTMNPIQDLHGYSNPWAGGAGKNKLPVTVADLKSLNTSGTWNGNTYTFNNGTFTILTDAGNNVIGIKVNGTFNAETMFTLTDIIDNNGYIINGCTNGSSTSYRYRIQYFTPSGTIVQHTQHATNGDYTLHEPDVPDNSWNRIKTYIWIANGYTADNVLFYPMIRLTTVTDATFEPYTNICPISGRTEVELGQSGRNLYNSATQTPDKLIVWANGTFTSDTNSVISDYIRIKSGTIYTNFIGYIFGYDLNKNYIGSWNGSSWVKSTGQNGTSFTFSGAEYIRIEFRSSQNSNKVMPSQNIMLCFDADTTYEPYQGETHTHQYGQTVYGGEDDFVNGGLSVEWGYIASYNGETLPGEWISDRDVYAPDTTPTTGAEVAYKLSTPTTISTSAEDITTVEGTNIISGTEPISECKYTELATVDDLIKIIGGQ